MNQLAQRLRDKRGDSSTRLMAQAIDRSQGFYIHLERGTRIPKQERDIIAIAELLDVSTDEVYALAGTVAPDIIAHLSGNYPAVMRLRTLEGI